MVELAQAGAFASSDILPVIREFENPRHPEFADKSGWSLYQSATEIMKSQSPRGGTKATRGSPINLVLKGRHGGG